MKRLKEKKCKVEGGKKESAKKEQTT